MSQFSRSQRPEQANSPRPRRCRRDPRDLPAASHHAVNGPLQAFAPTDATLAGLVRGSALERRHDRAIIDASLDGILTCNLGGRIEDLNPAAERLFGCRRCDAVGLRFVELLAPECADTGMVAIARSAPGNGDTGTIELVGLRADRSRFPMQLVVVHAAPPVAHLMTLIVHDLSALRAAEQEARRHFDALAHATRLASMAEIATGLAHEVSQPITAILTYASAAERLLQNGAGRECLSEPIGRISRHAGRAADLLRRLRDYIHPNQTESRPGFLNACVHDVLDLLRPEIVGSGTCVELLLDTTLPALPMDRTAMEQVILNLVRNAIDAMAEVADASRRLSIATAADPDHGVASLSIRDHGRGLPAGDPEQLFAPYFSTKPQGLGLGLSICRGIVEDHGGRLWATPHPDGASFDFVLPLDGRHAPDHCAP